MHDSYNTTETGLVRKLVGFSYTAEIFRNVLVEIKDNVEMATMTMPKRYPTRAAISIGSNNYLKSARESSSRTRPVLVDCGYAG